jgi:tetratricopeptide (TPR) repeat protein
LLVLMITCSNNAATCCTKLERWDDAEKFARNALVIIDALEPKRGMRIHKLLIQTGYTDSKLFGEWRVKSFIIIARALAEKGYSEQAIEILKQAREVIDKYTAQEFVKQPALKSSVKTLIANGKEINKLHKACKDRRKVERDKEKQRARAMFGLSSLATVTEAEEKKEMFDSDTDSPVNKSPETVPALEESSNVSIDSPPGKMKKRVSFSKLPPTVQEFERDAIAKIDLDEDREALEWYQDEEVLTGLAIFAGSLGLTVLALNFALGQRR